MSETTNDAQMKPDMLSSPETRSLQEGITRDPNVLVQLTKLPGRKGMKKPGTVQVRLYKENPTTCPFVGEYKDLGYRVKMDFIKDPFGFNHLPARSGKIVEALIDPKTGEKPDEEWVESHKDSWWHVYTDEAELIKS